MPGAAADLIGDKLFDIVLAANTCARLRLDAAALAGLRDLLVPGGLFIAVEPEPNAVWDIVFGQDAAWWSRDRWGASISPLRSGEEWQAELTDAGFKVAAAASLTDGPWPVAAFWGNAPPGRDPVAVEPVPSRTIAVIAEDTPLSRALTDRLEADGHYLALAEAGDPSAAERHIAGHEDGSAIVIFIAAEPEATSGVATQIASLARIARSAVEHCAHLLIVTTDTQQATVGGRQTGLAGAAIWGFARVLANELPRLSLRMLDLAGAESAKSLAHHIAEEIAAAKTETEIVWTPQGRHVMRLRSGLPPHFRSRGGALTLTAGPTGGLHSLGWVSRATRALGPGEIEIEVHAAGLNFRDVMWAMGLLPEEALIDGFAGATYGLECAGVVRAVGAGVTSLTIGDRVMALAPAALGTRVVTTAEAAVPLPAGLGFVAAATLPVAFITVIYALGHLAQLEAGEHVLVHAAAGGVGLAAIQYAKHRGAVVIATAGSKTKRTFLRLAGADHVFDSRDLAFADQVREITGGAGVDVVLNSLSGEAMERSLELLRPFGRFLELGKRDFYLNRRLHLRPLRHNVSYFAIDIDQLPLRRPALARSLLAEVSTLLRDGVIRPLAHRTFRYSEFDEAFRLMQASGHIGKLVLVPDRDDVFPVRAPTNFAVRADATYLVTGGIEGFGFEAARWLVSRGARAIALLGRRGLETPGCEARIAELTAAGADVRVYRGDVADRASLAAVLTEIRASQPPLCGVVHAAAAIDDRLAAEIDPAGVDYVLRPKIAGAIALDELTRGDPIELFLLFSSATTLLGAPGQGAYVAANLALEALARRRHAEGRPALAVGWGPIEDAGYLAQRPEMREALARRLGAVPIPASQALAVLPAMLASGLPVVSFADANWGEARRILPVLGTPLFSEIRYNHEGSATDERLMESLRSLDPDAAQTLLQKVVAEEAERILRLPPGDLDRMRPLSELGMDSLMAVELRLALEGRLRIDLPLVSLVEGTSVASIAIRLGNGLTVRAEGVEIETLAARHGGFDEAVGAMARTVVSPKTAAE